jgi:alpha-tubulin suppressor-like RCC1 family protein
VKEMQGSTNPITPLSCSSCWQLPYATWGQLPGEKFEQIGVGYDYGCALKADGTLRCWGGAQPYPGDPPPSRAQPPSGGGYVKLSVGLGHACAIHQEGHIDCWGDNSHGQLDAPDPDSLL